VQLVRLGVVGNRSYRRIIENPDLFPHAVSTDSGAIFPSIGRDTFEARRVSLRPFSVNVVLTRCAWAKIAPFVVTFITINVIDYGGGLPRHPDKGQSMSAISSVTYSDTDISSV
jgi:hypothetical protein